MRISRPYAISTTAHFLILLFLFIGLPSFLQPPTRPEEKVITVELLPVSEMTNVKPKQATPPKDKKTPQPSNPEAKPALPEPKKPEEKQPPKPEPPKPDPVKQKELEPLPQKEKPKEEVKKTEPPKPEEKKEPKKKEKKKEEPDPFASVLKSLDAIEKQAEKEPEKTDKEEAKAEDLLGDAPKADNYKPGLPLSISEKDAIRQQIMKNWTVLAGVKDANQAVLLKISFAPDGTVTDVEIQDKGRYSSDPTFRAMVDSAVRAVHKSSPILNLPKEKYDVRDGWREVILNFDPKDMLY